LRVVTVVGARPQFVKVSPVSRALAEAGFREVLVHTGQHFDPGMSDVFFDELGIPRPDHNLGIAGGSHGEQTGRMLAGVEEILLRERPGMVLVYGDTNSTLAGALAASKLHIPVAHVEAGLRSFNRRMPEEINRVVSDHLSDWLFAPTPAAVRNLATEGIAGERVCMVGDVMYDAALRFGALAESRGHLLGQMGVERSSYVLATIHRQENTDDAARLRSIVDALGAVAEEVPVVLPIHPRTRKECAAQGIALTASGLRVVEPVGYLDMLLLEKNARLIATDSGGVQKEAYFFGVPCVTLRSETEWVELVEAGWNTLAPPGDARAVVDAIRAALRRPAPAARGEGLYGDGDAAGRIVAALASARGPGAGVPVPGVDG